MIVDAYITYRFLRNLTTPFEKWDAYTYGIIDENGNIIKKSKELTTIKERESFSIFDRLTLNMKKILAKIPGGSTRFASYAAAIALLKEDSELTEEEFEEVMAALIGEDGIANSVGSGNFAGLPPDDPPIRKRKKKNASNNSIFSD